MSQEEMDAALDALEADNGTTLDDLDENSPGDDQPLAPIDDNKADKADNDNVDTGVVDDPPPGYIGYEEWVESGKDPKKFRGEDAYTDQYNQIQENREIKAQITGLNDTLKHVVTANDEWRNNQMESMRADLTAELAQAKDSADVDGALAAQAKIDNLKPVQTQQAPQQHPLIADFRQKNPLADPSSPRFNADYNADVEGFYDSMVSELTQGGSRQMTDGQITRCLKLAQKKATDLNPELFTSTRNNRQTITAKPRKAEKVSTDYRARLKGIGNSKNSSDSNAAIDMYDMLLESGGKDAAENFAKANLGEK